MALPSAICNVLTMGLAALAGQWCWFMIATLGSMTSIYGWLMIRHEDG